MNFVVEDMSKMAFHPPQSAEEYQQLDLFTNKPDKLMVKDPKYLQIQDHKNPHKSQPRLHFRSFEVIRSNLKPKFHPDSSL